MRRVILVVALLSFPAFADEPRQITIRVGEQKPLCQGTCYAPICDDPSVAVISSEGTAVVRGVGPGKTLCSVNTGSGRQVYEIVVSAPEREKR